MPDDLLTPDMSLWTVNGATSDKAHFQGAMKIFASIFCGTLTYEIDGRIAPVVEFMNQFVVSEKIAPLMLAAMTGTPA